MDEIESTDAVTDSEIDEIVNDDSENEDESAAEDQKDDEGAKPADKPKETLEQKRARLQRELKQTEKKLGVNGEESAPKPKSGNLDETQLDYLDLKGITETEDIKVVQEVVKKTGMTVREALKDDYVVSKLASNKEARDVKDATPSSNKRGSGAPSTNLEAAIAKFEKTGELPADFETASKVTDAIQARTGSNKPAWHS